VKEELASQTWEDHEIEPEKEHDNG
jgi:hypothetical protein